MKNNITEILILLSLSFLVMGCLETMPMTKSEYMGQFEYFASKLKQNCLCKQPKPIPNLEKDYINLSQTFYDLYYDELTTEDIQKVWTYRGLYFSCKVSLDARDLAKSYFQELETYISKN